MLENYDVFFVDETQILFSDKGSWHRDRLIECSKDLQLPLKTAASELAGWYWWFCFPGCMPESEPDGPYDTEEDAVAAVYEHAITDDDYIIQDGRGSACVVSQTGNVLFIGPRDECEAFVVQHMNKEGFFPNTWHVNDHGNISEVKLP
jgi:hypothetical protein